jgi:hypothetical protein
VVRRLRWKVESSSRKFVEVVHTSEPYHWYAGSTLRLAIDSGLFDVATKDILYVLNLKHQYTTELRVGSCMYSDELNQHNMIEL